MKCVKAKIRKDVKKNRRKSADGSEKITTSQYFRVTGIPNTAPFENNESVVIMSADDFKEMQEQLEILENQQTNTDPVNNVRISETNMLLSKNINGIIKQVTDQYDQQIREQTRQNIADVSEVFENLCDNIDERNQMLMEVKENLQEHIDTINRTAQDFDNELLNKSRFKWLLHKNEYLLGRPTVNIMEVMAELGKLTSLNIDATAIKLIDRLIAVPQVDIDADAILEAMAETQSDIVEIDLSSGGNV